MNIFEKGNRITTNKLNCFEILAVNEYQICCQNLLNKDFIVFDKTEHKFSLVDNEGLKEILVNCLKEVLGETYINDKEKEHVMNQMSYRINAWI